MPEIQLYIAESDKHIEDIRRLFEEYANLRKHDAALGDYEKELSELPGKYASPQGALIIAYFQNEPAGCVAFQPFDEGICEMKRMFVRPTLQGKKIGHALVQTILKQAKKSGYQKMYLDTHPWMNAAHRLYQKYGFTERERYNNNPTIGIRFFEKEI